MGDIAFGDTLSRPNDTLIVNGILDVNRTATHLHSPQTSVQSAVINLGYLFTAICVVMVMLRTFIRPLNHEKYKIDDFVMIGAMFVLAAIAATNPLVVSQSGYGA